MLNRHAFEVELEEFSQGRLTPEESLPVAWHLSRCSYCRRRLQQQHPAGEALLDSMLGNVAQVDAGGSSSYEVAFARVYDRLGVAARTVQRTRELAPLLYDELIKHPHKRRLLMVTNSRRYRSWGLAELMLYRARQRWADDPETAAELAELALEVARRLDVEETGSLFLNDLKTRAWAYLGNARRIISDLRGAETAFQEAERLIHGGSGDPLERAELLDLRATLYKDQGHFERALQTLNRAIAAYRRANERHLAGRALIKKAVIYQHWAQPEKAIPLLQRAARLIDAREDRRLTYCLQHILVLCLSDSGRPEEARRLLPQVRRLALELGNRLDLLRFRWIEGLVWAGLGEAEKAEAGLLAARQGFLQRKIPYDAALVSLDLAALYLRQGRTRETRELSSGILPLFEAQQVGRESLAALLLFVEAAELETLTQGTIRKVADALQRTEAPEAELFDIQR